MTARPMTDLDLNTVVEQCRREAKVDRAQELGYCFELFRRALEDRLDGAWAAIEAQYGRLILTWLYATAKGSPLDPEEADELKMQALAKFWRTLTRRPMHLASRFEHVGGLLRYLHQCAVTTVLDQRRKDQRYARLQERVEKERSVLAYQPAPDHDSLDRVYRQDRVETIFAWFRQEVTDPQEQLLLHLSFEQDMTPAQIAQTHPNHFADVNEVRRIKERVLKRAKRAFVMSNE